MIEGNLYIKIVEEYFNFLVTDFAFKISEKKIRGNAFYDVQYKDSTRIISISYENIENYLEVIIYSLQNGELPNYDDTMRIHYLSQFNAKVLSRVSRVDIDENSNFFIKFKSRDPLERTLLKHAKELRLYLNHSKELI